MREILQTEDNETGETLETPILLATASVADPMMVNFVVNQPVGNDGRSEWQWFRLANGDLILGVFPCGDTYTETEADPNRP